MTDDLYEIARFDAVQPAQLLKSFLESQGLDVHISGDHVGTIRPMTFVIDPVIVYVREKDFSTAVELLKEYHRENFYSDSSPEENEIPKKAYNEEMRTIRFLTIFGVIIPIVPSLVAAFRLLFGKRASEIKSEAPRSYWGYLVFNLGLVALYAYFFSIPKF